MRSMARTCIIVRGRSAMHFVMAVLSGDPGLYQNNYTISIWYTNGFFGVGI